MTADRGDPDARPTSTGGRKDDEPSLSTYAGVGLQFALTIILFLFIGQWLDRRLDTAPWFTIAGVFAGAAGGFYSLYSRLMAQQRRAERRDR